MHIKSCILHQFIENKCNIFVCLLDISIWVKWVFFFITSQRRHNPHDRRRIRQQDYQHQQQIDQITNMVSDSLKQECKFVINYSVNLFLGTRLARRDSAALPAAIIAALQAPFSSTTSLGI